jgi:hypothetical protein
MGAKSRSKGLRAEREIVHLCRDAGFEAHRVPLSGAVREYPGDLMIDGLRAEVKARGNGSGFSLLERWLGKNDLLFLRRDRSEPMVVLSWTTWARLAKKPLD